MMKQKQRWEGKREEKALTGIAKLFALKENAIAHKKTPAMTFFLGETFKSGTVKRTISQMFYCVFWKCS